MNFSPRTFVSRLAVAALLAAPGLGCGRSALDFPLAEAKSLPQACADVCEKSACDGSTEYTNEQLQACTLSCSDQFERAADVSTACSDAYYDYIFCLDALTCEAYAEQLFDGEGGDCRVAAAQLSSLCESL